DAGASANSRATVHKVGRVRSNQVAQPTRCCRSKNRTFKLRNVGSPSPQILQCVVFVTSSLTMFRIAVAGINVHSPTGYVNSVCRRRFGIRKGQATSDPCSENISRRVSVRYRMAFFGWPRAYEDQAERAVRARLEALAGVQALEAPGGERSQARAAIASGRVVVGDLSDAGRQEGAIAGETPNLAARLQECAHANELVISEATRRLVSDVFELENL